MSKVSTPAMTSPTRPSTMLGRDNHLGRSSDIPDGRW
jgi:hypothetical protein